VQLGRCRQIDRAQQLSYVVFSPSCSSRIRYSAQPLPGSRNSSHCSLPREQPTGGLQLLRLTCAGQLLATSLWQFSFEFCSSGQALLALYSTANSYRIAYNKQVCCTPIGPGFNCGPGWNLCELFRLRCFPSPSI